MNVASVLVRGGWRLVILWAVLAAWGCGKPAEQEPRTAQNKNPRPAPQEPAPVPPVERKQPGERPALLPPVPGTALGPDAYVRTPLVWKGIRGWTISTDQGLAFGPNSLSFSGGQLALQPETSAWVSWDDSKGTLVPAPFAGKYNAITADGKTAARVEDATVQLLAGGTSRELPGHKVMPQLTAFSPDGKLLATGVEEGVWFWDTATGNKLRTSAMGFPDFSCAAFSPDSKSLALAQIRPDQKGLLSLMAVQTARVERTIALDRPLHTLSWSPDGKRLAAVDWDGRLVLLDPEAGRVVFTSQKDLFFDTRPTWFSDSKRLALVGQNFGVLVWDVSDAKVLQTCRGHTAPVNGLALSPDGKTLVSASADKSVRFWNPETGDLRGTLLLLPNNAFLAISPNGHFKGSEKIEEKFVYRVSEEKFNRVVEYTPLVFASQFGWVNKPGEVRLLGR